ncbi:hypothetical protein COPCOM_02131 [Coprococcus comes ATCC 27758]|uniref:Uncharacterized protein n=1 Tax=Coprococcus comes ATCC 27758 TaxID=470146 RepID=C0BAM8_9FIRM|nr:hypothetical protein COPCOM_02131 [Coprococcus comes ATCC 27758]
MRGADEVIEFHHTAYSKAIFLEKVQLKLPNSWLENRQECTI